MGSSIQNVICALCFVLLLTIAVPLSVAAQTNLAGAKKAQPDRQSQTAKSASALGSGDADYVDQAGVPYLQFRALPNKILKENLAKLDPRHVSADTLHFWTGVTLRTDGKQEEAVAEFEKINAADSLSDWGTCVFGDTYLEAAQPQKAYRLADKRLARGSKDHDVYRVRADATLAQGNFEKAAADYLLAAAQAKTKGNIYLAKSAECRRNLHQYDAAIKLFSQAIDGKSYSPESYIYTLRARCYESVGKWAEAASDFTSSINVSQKRRSNRTEDVESMVTAQAYLDRSKCYDHMGKTVLAARDRATHQKLSRAVENDIIGSPK